MFYDERVKMNLKVSKMKNLSLLMLTMLILSSGQAMATDYSQENMTKLAEINRFINSIDEEFNKFDASRITKDLIKQRIAFENMIKDTGVVTFSCKTNNPILMPEALKTKECNNQIRLADEKMYTIKQGLAKLTQSPGMQESSAAKQESRFSIILKRPSGAKK